MTENPSSDPDEFAEPKQKPSEQEREITVRESDARYRALFESTGDAIMLLDASGFVECNSATLKFFRCASLAEFLSKHPSDLSPPYQPDGTDSRTAANEWIAETYRTGMTRFEWVHRRTDGTDVTADVLLVRVDLESRSIIQAVVRDVTERKKVEQALRDSQEKLEQRVQERTADLAAANDELKREIAERKQAEEELAFERFLLTTMMEHAPDFIFFKDTNSRFIRISKGLADYYGLSDPLEACGRSDLDFYDSDRARQYLKDEQEIMRTGKPSVDKEEEQRWPDGHVTWVSTSKVPLYDDGGRIIGTFGISRDTTLRKEAEIELQRAKNAAESANRAKSDFLANMSHEIRTPMNAIIGMTELVLDTELTDSQCDYLKMVRDSGESLLKLINDILDFSKVEAGKLELVPTTFDLREILGDTMKSLGLRAHGKGLELACEIRPDVPQWLIGDAGRLRQIIVNLVGNAIKFTTSGEVVLAIDCSHNGDNRLTLHGAVTDTGAGIPDDKQAMIFRAFEQADSSITRRFGGTGLGLAICARLAKAMGGDIWVESELGHGSTFHVTIQMEVSDSAPPVAPLASRAIIEGTRVLVVDDNATNRRILDAMLHNWRMEPTTVADASEALTVLRTACTSNRPFKLVLTDANMPEQDGFELVEDIKRDGQLGSPIIMMLTSGGRPGDIARCESLGVASYLLKPIKQSELFDAIAMAFGITISEDDQAGEGQDEEARMPESLKILLAEDSLVNQKLAVGLLEKYGHQVTVANDGREALASLDVDDFDLVLMDVQMPEMDGLETTMAIRTEEETTGKHTPIIAMTAHAMKGDRERCLASGMDSYVAKPIRIRELFATIAKVLSDVGYHDEVDYDQTDAEATTDGAIDWQEALKTAGGNPGLMREVILVFRDECPQKMQEIHDAIREGDASLLRRAAHTLKGALRSIGAAKMGVHAETLEEMGRDEKLDEGSRVLTHLEADIGLLDEEISQYLRDTSA